MKPWITKKQVSLELGRVHDAAIDNRSFRRSVDGFHGTSRPPSTSFSTYTLLSESWLRGPSIDHQFTRHACIYKIFGLFTTQVIARRCLWPTIVDFIPYFLLTLSSKISRKCIISQKMCLRFALIFFIRKHFPAHQHSRLRICGIMKQLIRNSLN